MAEFHPELSKDMQRFIKDQNIFFVASASCDSHGRVNLSPKGYSCFTVIDSKNVAYIDYPGSGNETAKHIAQGGMVTVMFCSFDKKPMVLRLYCKGEVIPFEKAREILPGSMLEDHRNARQIILLHIEEVMTSCGHGVPYFKYLGDRETLRKSLKKRGAKAWLKKHRSDLHD
jgi:hypothetical protein